jgi:hypothetical protein
MPVFAPELYSAVSPQFIPLPHARFGRYLTRAALSGELHPLLTTSRTSLSADEPAFFDVEALLQVFPLMKAGLAESLPLGTLLLVLA